jgi:hypothetical protein
MIYKKELADRTLTQNCGANVIRTLTKLRAKHAAEPGCSFGINGETGEVRWLLGSRRHREWHLQEEGCAQAEDRAGGGGPRER